MWIALYLTVIVAATAVTWHGAVRLEKACEVLAVHYRLPHVVRGAVLAAVGSSFPEFASTVLATALHGEFDLGLSVIRRGTSLYDMTGMRGRRTCRVASLGGGALLPRSSACSLFRTGMWLRFASCVGKRE